MFTGIITDQGLVKNVAKTDGGIRLEIACSYDVAGIDIGASIAHDGVCLTVVATNAAEKTYEVEAWEEALRLTTLGTLEVGDKVNLERALKVGDELGGHIVSGHVDGMAKIIAVKDEGAARRFTLEVPQELAKFVAPKGSVALDGTSLTVNKVAGNTFDVLLIAHTLEVTGWGKAQVGHAMNFEIDTMARYAARLAQFDK